MTPVDHGAPDREDAAFERVLLESARSDGVSDAAAREAWSRFSTAAGVVALGTGVVPGTSAGAGSLGRAARRAAVKWLLVGAVGGSAVTAAWMGARRGGSPVPARVPQSVATRAPASVATRAPASVDEGALPRVAQLVAPSSAENAAPPPALAHASTTGRARGRPNAAIPARREHDDGAPASTLAAEVSALDAVRAAIATGAVHDALRLVDAYHRDFPAGQLAPDADALAIEALAAGGDRAGAAQRAARFLERYPKDPHAARIGALLDR